MTDTDIVTRLAEEAYDQAQYPDFIEAVNIDAPITRHNVFGKFVRVFAALVAEECAKVADDQAMWKGTTPAHCASAIRAKFKA